MKREELFPVLEPPAGGWGRMKARLRPAPRRSLWLAAASGAAAAGLAAALLAAPPVVDLTVAARVGVTAGLLGLEPEGAEPVIIRGEGAAVQRLNSSNPSVVLYRLAVLEVPAEGER